MSDIQPDDLIVRFELMCSRVRRLRPQSPVAEETLLFLERVASDLWRDRLRCLRLGHVEQRNDVGNLPDTL
jgi:hypothetical protein